MAPATPEEARAAAERVVREETGYVLAALVGHLGDLDLAEDALQDALVAALRHWPAGGVPGHPRAWLLQTARRKAIDRIRRRTSFETKRPQLELLAELQAQDERDEADETIPDERLRLVFTCCHTALAEPTRVALTLKTLGGLTTAEIARAFLLPEKTLAQRLVRAKRKIKAAGIPYEVPTPELWPERLDSVLSVIYLIFNEGYATTSGRTLVREELCLEAIRLGRIVVDLLPREPEAVGLLALMLLHDSRRAARTDETGRFLTLERQDRGLWDRERIDAGLDLLGKALALGAEGPYQLQAAISAVHARAETYDATDWNEIWLLYCRLYELEPSPVVRLNAVAALSFAQGPDAALESLEELERQGALERYQPFHACRADVLRRAGKRNEAAAAYRRALELTGNAAERQFLEQRLRDVTAAD